MIFKFFYWILAPTANAYRALFFLLQVLGLRVLIPIPEGGRPNRVALCQLTSHDKDVDPSDFCGHSRVGPGPRDREFVQYGKLSAHIEFISKCAGSSYQEPAESVGLAETRRQIRMRLGLFSGYLRPPPRSLGGRGSKQLCQGFDRRFF